MLMKISKKLDLQLEATKSSGDNVLTVLHLFADKVFETDDRSKENKNKIKEHSNRIGKLEN